LFFNVIFIEVVLNTDLFELLIPKEHLILVFGTNEEAFLTISWKYLVEGE
jgi:hypothetical protein